MLYWNHQGSYFDGIRSITQRLQSWYFGRPLVSGNWIFFQQFSKIFHQSINQKSRQQLRNEPHESHHRSQQLQNHSNNARDPARRQTNDIKSSIHQNSDGNLLISIPKTKASIGIAIEGGANTKHPLPRIINIHVSLFLSHYFLLLCHILLLSSHQQCFYDNCQKSICLVFF